MALETIWFLLAALMLATYVVLDGFDLGAGILHFGVGKTEEERSLVLRSIGPFWDGNEVWLVATGGVLVLAFPPLYAEGFSGFYLALMIVLWLLIGRACAIELRHQIPDPAWIPFWDRIFQVTSVLLAVGFGAALGNVVRGVPFGEEGRFFLPLWTDLLATKGDTGVLDVYTILCGLISLAALAHHGGAWLALRLDGEPKERARRAVRRGGWIVLALTVVGAAATARVQPHVVTRYTEQPWLFAFPVLALGALLFAGRSARRGRDGAAFLGSSGYLVAMLVSIVLGLYPYVLPSSTDPSLGLTVTSARAGDIALRTGLWWWGPGIALAIAYQVFAYRKFWPRSGAPEGYS